MYAVRSLRVLTNSALVFAVGDRSGVNTVTCHTLDDLRDCCDPAARAALLKACTVVLGIVDLTSSQTLSEQLAGGYHVTAHSNLPVGSGCGTSSILACAVLMALDLVRPSEQTLTERGLVHAVLNVEQLLTTGGGWQDQVGGLLPGIKLAYSRAALPLSVDFERLNAPAAEELLHQHMMLIYTGRTRLAKNLLSSVVEQWWHRDAELVAVVDALVQNAHAMRTACENGNLGAIATCLNTFWQHKKKMAVGAEPTNVSTIIALLQDHLLAASMMGAGGGGFLMLLTRERLALATIKQVLQAADLDFFDELTFHTVSVDRAGPQITITQ
jgi:fucokinase